MSEDLVRNESTALSKIILSVRAGTFDVKAWNEWNYRDKLCVMCQVEDDNMKHFMNCRSYRKTPLGNIIGQIFMKITQMIRA